MSPGGRATGQALRFLVVGGLNTVLTGSLFVGLSSVWPVALSFTLAFAVGVAFAVVVTPRLVFRARAGNAQRLRYAAWYLSVYVLGLGMVYVLHDGLQMGNAFVAAITFVATAGLSFVGARLLFSPRTARAAEPIDRRAKV